MLSALSISGRRRRLAQEVKTMSAVWGVFLALNWWDVYRRKDKPPKAEGPTEEQVRQEMDALRQEGLRASAAT
jgi:hypothetical protein